MRSTLEEIQMFRDAAVEARTAFEHALIRYRDALGTNPDALAAYREVAHLRLVDDRRAPPGDLYDLKIRGLEYTDVPPPPHTGSFAQLGGRGQDNWILLQEPEIRFIQKWAHNKELWNWAASKSGDIYIQRDDEAMTVRWPVLLMSSATGQPRQYVKLAPFESDDKFRWFIGIPHQANGDYSEFTPEKYPHFFIWCPTIRPDNTVQWTSHKRMLFLMPLFQPGTGYEQSPSANEHGGQVDADIFLGPHSARRVRQDDGPV
jgi:hypothetical protein